MIAVLRKSVVNSMLMIFLAGSLANAQNSEDIVKGIFGALLNELAGSVANQSAQEQYSTNLREVFVSYSERDRKYIQRALSSLDYYNSSNDGLWGKGTLRGVLEIIDDAEYEEILSHPQSIAKFYNYLLLGFNPNALERYRYVSPEHTGDWAQMSAHERVCVNRALEKSNITIRDLISSKVSVSDNRIFPIISSCRFWAQGVRINAECELQTRNGTNVRTRCDEYFATKSGQEITELAALEAILNGSSIQRILEETKQASIVRQRYEQQQLAKRKDQERKYDEMVQRVRALEGSWCSFHPGVVLNWECKSSFGCLPSNRGMPNASENIEWTISEGGTLRYVAETKSQVMNIVRNCTLKNNSGENYDLSCEIRQKFFDQATEVLSETTRLQKCN